MDKYLFLDLVILWRIGMQEKIYLTLMILIVRGLKIEVIVCTISGNIAVSKQLGKGNRTLHRSSENEKNDSPTFWRK